MSPLHGLHEDEIPDKDEYMDPRCSNCGDTEFTLTPFPSADRRDMVEKSCDTCGESTVEEVNKVNSNITDPIAESAAERGVMLPDEDFDPIVNTTDELYAAIESALVNDKPMDPEEVRDFWDDTFLTNVIVPFLDHLRRHFSDEWETAIRLQQWNAATSHSMQRSRLEQVIRILEEWRG